MTNTNEHMHTGLPWYISANETETFCAEVSCTATDEIIVENLTQANAEFIVRACNSHYELLEELNQVKLTCKHRIEKLRKLVDAIADKLEGRELQVILNAISELELREREASTSITKAGGL